MPFTVQHTEAQKTDLRKYFTQYGQTLEGIGQFMTTQCGPIREPSPIVTRPRMAAPAPSSTPRPMTGASSTRSAFNAPIVTFCRMTQSSPIVA